MTPFLQAVGAFTPLSPPAAEALAGIARRGEYPKGHQLLAPGGVAERVYWIERGLTRTFYYLDGRDVTDWLSVEGEFAGSMVSFLTHLPDRRGVETLEPSVLWAVPARGLEALYAEFHEVERLGRLLVSHGLVLMQQRFDELHFATAAERYQSLLRTRPGLVQRVPVGVLASYLGVAAETLSRIRAGG